MLFSFVNLLHVGKTDLSESVVILKEGTGQEPVVVF